VGIPKTIDNDIPIIDKSFGFETAVAEGIKAIRSAWVESRGANYGIGLVRIMGRDAGWIAMDATNASRDVNVCLVPEFQFGIKDFYLDLYGPDGLLEYIYSELLVEKHLVIVVAEGAGDAVRDHVLADGGGLDKSNNKKMPVNSRYNVGYWEFPQSQDC
jgi:6-phosphofructokinase 1